MQDCIFCKIRDRIVPKDFVYEDDDVMVFEDIKPIKPIHLLVIPKEHIREFGNANNPEIFRKVGSVIQKMIGEKDLSDNGYRIVVNGGGAQLVNHLHFHLLGPLGHAVEM